VNSCRASAEEPLVHELYIAQCILDAAKRSLPDGMSSADVEQIRVEIGQLDAVVPDTLAFLFDAIKKEYGMPGAELSVTDVPVLCRCRQCEAQFTVELPIFLCPACASSNTEIVRGRGILLTGITVRDDEGEGNGNADHS